MTRASSKLPMTMVADPPSERPLMIFDGECNFCRHWIERWRRSTRTAVDYVEFQNLGARYPEIPRAHFEGAVQLIELDGSVLSGADAVFRLFDFSEKRPRLLSAVKQIPGFLPLSRSIYDFIATHRVFFSNVTRLLFGGRNAASG